MLVMATAESFGDELLQRAAAELATAINDSLPAPNDCQHRFSNEFEHKMQELINEISPKSFAIAIQDSTLSK